MSYKLNSVRCP